MNGLRFKVLIVDDSVLVRDQIKQMLNEFDGLEVVGAESGQQAILIAQREPIDLVLCDLEMPGLDGISTLRILRSRFSGAKLPVLMLTGCADTKQKVVAFDAGANDYLVKPVDPRELRARVGMQLRLKETHEELVRARIEHVEAMREQSSLMERLGAVRRFAGIIAHELNNPVAVMKVNHEVLRDFILESEAFVAGVYELVGHKAEHLCEPLDELSSRCLEGSMLDAVRGARDVLADCQDGVERIRNLTTSFERLRLMSQSGEDQEIDLPALVSQFWTTTATTPSVVVRGSREDLHRACELLNEHIGSNTNCVVARVVIDENRFAALQLDVPTLELSDVEMLHIAEPGVRIGEKDSRVRMCLDLTLVTLLFARNGGHLQANSLSGRGTRFVVTFAQSASMNPLGVSLPVGLHD